MSVPEHDHDIYRGEPSQPQQPLYTAPSIISTSTSSSASSLLAASRLGAIAAKLELAISRWAKNVRGNSSSASDSSSSHSPSSSIVTLTKSQHTRRRSRRSSVSSLRTLQSEREISARISRMKALEESRRIPRHFTLYLPLSISLQSPQNHSGAATAIEDRQSTKQSLTSSTSLTLVLNQLDLAIKKAGRNRRTRQRHRSPPRNPSSLDLSSFPSQLVHDNQFGLGPDHPRAPRGRKGKHRESSTPAKFTSIMEEPIYKSQAWFLDVANPTWADLRAIGKLLHIHPLTLEDILQQDPREKLELFTNLGYYFISFRAIESKATKERLQREAAASDDNFDEGSIGEANIYLTVFDDGICCFHFTDVSEHTDRVRNKIVSLQEDVDMSSDWIAHDILDSIVDSFFPFLEYIETEAVAIDNTVFAGTLDPIIPTEPPKVVTMISGLIKRTRTNTNSQLDEKHTDNQEFEDEKSQSSPRPRFVAPYLTVSLAYHRTKRFISNAWKSCTWRTKIEPPATSTPTPSQLTLRRIGSTRKLVTSLVRLLATKSDVLTAFRKRLSRASTLKPKSMTARSSEELAIYSGDVQDHILTLQHSLVYYERMLSDWNPIYVSQLGAEVSIAKNKADVNLLYVTTVAVCCSTNLIVTGLFSVNVTIPHNLIAEGQPFFWFIGIICVLVFISCTLLLLVRHWWKQSKRRRFVS